MDNKERAKEIEERIKEEFNFYNNDLPENVNLVWQGYIGSLLEWGLIEVEDHAKLIKILPLTINNPVSSVFMGEPGYHLKHK